VKIRVGIGFDIHRLAKDRELTLGGIRIPYSRGLEGHSDGDVLLHAVIDAILGAAGLGNIGQHFPDGDPRFSGADSRLLLREVARMIRDKGFAVGNIDCNVLAEEPRLGPYFASMCEAIAREVGVSSSEVGVKAKTMEGLGAVGRGEAISAEAVVLLIAD
jgi:2-C-methyl-D-erythritol 2,4-cyclodiphosphate synthase